MSCLSVSCCLVPSLHTIPETAEIVGGCLTFIYARANDSPAVCYTAPPQYHSTCVFVSPALAQSCSSLFIVSSWPNHLPLSGGNDLQYNLVNRYIHCNFLFHSRSTNISSLFFFLSFYAFLIAFKDNFLFPGVHDRRVM